LTAVAASAVYTLMASSAAPIDRSERKRIVKLPAFAIGECGRWVNATANPATRQRRIEVSISKMSNGQAAAVQLLTFPHALTSAIQEKQVSRRTVIRGFWLIAHRRGHHTR
jgi:hypothetical protein